MKKVIIAIALLLGATSVTFAQDYYGGPYRGGYYGYYGYGNPYDWAQSERSFGLGRGTSVESQR